MDKPSKELVVDLINADTGRQFAYGEVTFDDPYTVNLHNRNTEVIVRGVLDAGYTGAKILHYNRIHMTEAMLPSEPEGVELMVPNDGFITTGEIAERLNQMFGLALEPEDFVDVDLEITSLPMSVQLTANPVSLAWRGGLAVSLVQDRPMFDDAVTDHNLDGFEVPTGDVSGLVDPTVVPNILVTFQSGNVLDMGSVPSGGFMVCSNSELELSAAARANGGMVATIADSEGYLLQLGSNSTWCIPLSVGLLNPQPGQKVTDLYDVTLAITCPDNSVVNFTLEYNEQDEIYELVGTGATIIAGQYSGVDGDVFQHMFDMATITHLLGSVLTGPGGAPLGLYTARFQARRLNSMAPRLLTTFLVRATAST